MAACSNSRWSEETRQFSNTLTLPSVARKGPAPEGAMRLGAQVYDEEARAREIAPAATYVLPERLRAASAGWI